MTNYCYVRKRYSRRLGGFVKFDPDLRYMDINTEEWYYRVGKNAFLHNALDRIVLTRRPVDGESCSFEVTTPEGVYDAEGWDDEGNYVGKTKCFVFRDSFPIKNLKTTLSRINTIMCEK